MVTISGCLIDASKFSSDWKIIRTTAWVPRFLKNMRRRDKSAGELTAAELAAARLYCVRVLQEETFTPELKSLQWGSTLPIISKIALYNPFVDGGRIPLGGRLQCSDLSREQLHPLLLASFHRFTELLIMQTHFRLHHLGVRVVLSDPRT